MENEQDFKLEPIEREIIEVDEEHNITAEKVWTCNHCRRPMALPNKEQAIRHSNSCIFNEKVGSCLLCKHLKLERNAQYAKNVVNNRADVRYAIGSHTKAYCMEYNKWVKENEFVVGCKSFEYSDEMPIYVDTDEYLEQQELIKQAQKEYDELREENEKRYQEEQAKKAS